VEPAALLALHNALVIAKILRYEFPSDEWYAFNTLRFEFVTLTSRDIQAKCASIPDILATFVRSNRRTSLTIPANPYNFATDHQGTFHGPYAESPSQSTISFTRNISVIGRYIRRKGQRLDCAFGI
jgi:hypothetical protein